MRKLVATLILLVSSVTPAVSEMNLGGGVTVAFATVEEGQKILTSRDDFVQRMSPFDRAARMKTDQRVSEEDYLKFVRRNVLPWDDGEKQKIVSAFQGIEAELRSRSLPFPNEVFIVKTTGNEEGGAAYTRANAIVFPKADLKAPVAEIQKAICHELFHIMSRVNPDLRDELYAAIGFVRCHEVEFPSPLKPRKITNPDAPRNDHCIRLQVEGNDYWAVPILLSDSEKYDVKRGGEFFNYLQFRFLLVHRNDHSSAVTPIYDGEAPKVVELDQVTNFFDQVGKNTTYTMHPEEILADNFALLISRERNVPSPAILTRIEEVLNKRAIPEPNAAAGETNSLR